MKEEISSDELSSINKTNNAEDTNINISDSLADKKSESHKVFQTMSHPNKHKSCKKKNSKAGSLCVKNLTRISFICFMVVMLILRGTVLGTGHSKIFEFYISIVIFVSGIQVIINYLWSSFTSNEMEYKEYYQGAHPEKFGKKICMKCPSNQIGQKRIKPIRSHHCSMCKTCNTKMDHHCMFIQNCVGYANHKSYFHLLFFGVFWGGSMIYVLANVIVRINIYLFSGKTKVWFYVSVIISLQLIVMVLGVWVAVFNLCVYHVKMAFFNLTTIEDLVKFNRPFHLGVLSSLFKFFGNKFEMFLPFSTNWETSEAKLILGLKFSSKRDDPCKMKAKLKWKDKGEIIIKEEKFTEENKRSSELSKEENLKIDNDPDYPYYNLDTPIIQEMKEVTKVKEIDELSGQDQQTKLSVDQIIEQVDLIMKLEADIESNNILKGKKNLVYLFGNKQYKNKDMGFD